MATIDVAYVPQVIGEGLYPGHLVHVSQQRVSADGQLALAVPPDEEAVPGFELAPRLNQQLCWIAWSRNDWACCRRLRGRLGGPAQLEFAAASVGCPDTGVVVPPCLPEQARPRASGPNEGDSRQRVGRTLLPIARSRFTEKAIRHSGRIRCGTCFLREGRSRHQRRRSGTEGDDKPRPSTRIESADIERQGLRHGHTRSTPRHVQPRCRSNSARYSACFSRARTVNHWSLTMCRESSRRAVRPVAFSESG